MILHYLIHIYSIIERLENKSSFKNTVKTP